VLSVLLNLYECEAKRILSLIKSNGKRYESILSLSFLAVLRLEIRGLGLIGKCFTPWAMPLAFIKDHQVKGDFLKLGGSWDLNYLSRNSNILMDSDH
jgi:hypothetical protein